MAAETDYKTAFLIAQLFNEYSDDMESWRQALMILQKEAALSSVQLVFICTRNKKIIHEIQVGEVSTPLLDWISINETSIKDAVPLMETRQEYKTVNLSFALTDREWTSSYPLPRDALGPEKTEHAFVCASRFPEQNITVLIGLLREKGKKGFENEQLQLFSLLRKTWHESFSNFARHYACNSIDTSLRCMVDKAPLGWFIVDDSGCLIVANQKGRDIIHQGDLFNICSNNSNLKAVDRNVSEKLKEYIKLATVEKSEISDLYIRVNVEKSRNGYLLIISTVKSEQGSKELFNQELALIQVIDLDDNRSVEAKALQKAFDITVTEALVLKYLSEGLSLRQIAKIKRRSYHTIRNHVQRVMNKTGMHRQADLMLLVHTVVLASSDTDDTDLEHRTFK